MGRARLKKCVDTLLATTLILVAAVFAARFIASEAQPAVAGAGALKVVLDAGHGGMDGGAVGVNGTVEAGLNLTVAKLIEAELTARGVEVVMTRSTDEALGDTKAADMAARGKLIAQPADSVVSIHMNKFSDRSVKGSMAFYMTGSEQGALLAQSVIDAVTDSTGQGRRLANPGDYFVIRECAAPAVLVECGFLSNAEDERKLNDPDYQQKLAEGIVEGIMNYFSLA